MIRGKLGGRGSVWVGYHYSAVFHLSQFQVFILMKLPIFARFLKIKYRDSAKKSLQSFVRTGQTVEVVFWEPMFEDSRVAKNLFEVLTRKSKKAKYRSLDDLKFRAKFYISLTDLMRRDYNTVYTNRPELMTYFKPGAAAYTNTHREDISQRKVTPMAKKDFTIFKRGRR